MLEALHPGRQDTNYRFQKVKSPVIDTGRTKFGDDHVDALYDLYILNSYRLNDGVRGVDEAKYAFLDFPPNESASIFEKVERSLQGDAGEERGRFISDIFGFRNTCDFTTKLSGEKFKTPIPELIHNEGVYVLIEAMASNPEKYRMELGIIFSFASIYQMPQEIRDLLNPHDTQLDLKLNTSHKKWHLCDSAEEILVQSENDRGIMAIDVEGKRGFLGKFKGKLSALCVANFTTSEGKVFVQGNWYAPTDSQTSMTLEDSFASAQGRTELKDGEWALMRPVQGFGSYYSSRLLRNAIRYSEKIPLVHPKMDIYIAGKPVSRRIYRNNFKENF